MAYRILIVDDSTVTRLVLKKTIGMAGVPVDEILQASNGKEALAVLESRPVDVVFADLNMPEMNGMEMTRHIAAHPESSNDAVIIVVTTEACPARIEELRQLGVKGYVHKPFTPEQIRDTLMELAPCAG